MENEIYCYINGFLKWIISKKTSCVVENKKFSRKICILNLRNKKRVSLSEYLLGSKGERRSQKK